MFKIRLSYIIYQKNKTKVKKFNKKNSQTCQIHKFKCNMKMPLYS